MTAILECPHCSKHFHAQFEHTDITAQEFGNTVRTCTLYYQECPSCDKYILFLKFLTGTSQRTGHVIVRSNPESDKDIIMLYPKTRAAKPLPKEVSADYVKEYNEARAILEISPNASGALSRRCLQRLLREKANVKPGDLYDEIQEVLNSNKLPTLLAEAIDAIRNIGNFGAHPIKSKQTGSIVDVEPGEAEWNLEVLVGLFDFYFVQPAILQAKKDALNLKLQAAGKPMIK